ncbi:hypothetical protein Gotri_015497 [Gossypium trilobum]|uniref:Uncharacterized protein n=1 Tax=Gossypium trilobum TaxID=34281 RepID=A0A7J9E0C5_9ROSI|nr:hypothetical protein [Gossypium trilobum]
MCRVGLAQAKRMCHRSVSSRIRDLLGMKNVPEGHIAVYVGETSKSRFMIPISYLNHPLFEGLLNLAEEEFGFNYPTGRDLRQVPFPSAMKVACLGHGSC